MRIVGIICLVFGTIGVSFANVTPERRDKVRPDSSERLLFIGKQQVPVGPLASAGLTLAGIILIGVGSKRSPF